MTYVSKKNGFQRFNLTVRGTKDAKGNFRQVKRINSYTNFAAAAGGAKVIGATAGRATPVPHRRHREHQLGWGHRGQRRHEPAVRGGRPGRQEGGEDQPSPGQRHAQPGAGRAEVVPLAADPDSGSRFTALRQFALEVCVKDARRPRRSGDGSSPPRPTRSRPSAPRRSPPNLTLRSFKLKKAVKAAAVRLRGPGEPVHRRSRTTQASRKNDPTSRHRLRCRLRPRHDRARSRAPGLREGR